ncbi:MAG: hypothetical protein M1834_004862 [Cirrosporium novae-zelandiae]|nr:MAG: hypothetical protein M1834_004862 [Cirrosporium novae-zelandiae]
MSEQKDTRDVKADPKVNEQPSAGFENGIKKRITTSTSSRSDLQSGILKIPVHTLATRPSEIHKKTTVLDTDQVDTTRAGWRFKNDDIHASILPAFNYYFNIEDGDIQTYDARSDPPNAKTRDKRLVGR